jgi:hypothetical protein
MVRTSIAGLVTLLCIIAGLFALFTSYQQGNNSLILRSHKFDVQTKAGKPLFGGIEYDHRSPSPARTTLDVGKLQEENKAAFALADARYHKLVDTSISTWKDLPAQLLLSGARWELHKAIEACHDWPLDDPRCEYQLDLAGKQIAESWRSYSVFTQHDRIKSDPLPTNIASILVEFERIYNRMSSTTNQKHKSSL